MSTSPQLHPEVVTARERLKRGLAQSKEQHESGAPASEVCARLTGLLDTIVTRLYEAALTKSDTRTIESEIALIPNGGYGRRDVAPYSDVDLMLLTTSEAHDGAAELAKYLTQYICDAGLQLGFSLRTIPETLSLAMQDATIFTSLTESRYLAGDRALCDRFIHRYRQSARRKWKSLIKSIIEARRNERHQYGETVYLLEPNVKRSRGGLRDVHMVRWIGFTRYGERGPEDLYRIGALTRVDRRRLVRSHEFLLRLRNELHFHAGKSQDHLTRDEQVRLAELRQYEELSGVLPVERFMRDYFEQTGDIRYVSAHFVAGTRARSRVSAALAPLFSHPVERNLRVGPVHISATRKGLAKVCGDLDEVLRIMDLANMYNRWIDHRTWEAIRDTMSQRPADHVSEEAVSRFLSLLSQPGRLADLLRRLHQLRVLEKIIPAMHHARYLVQFNDYHKYTVDEHSIRAVECATEFSDDPRAIGHAYRDLRDKRLLHLALLIHDLGKGYDDEHTEVGRLIAVETARRLNLSHHDTRVLKFLVHRHLLMPHMAFRENMHDQSVILRLAVEVGSPDVLQMLYVHACADLAAVGPGVLNEWKLELLTELYQRTRRHLTAEDTSQSTAREARRRRAALRDMVGEDSHDPWWEKQIQALPAGYLLTVAPDRIHSVLQRLRDLPPKDVTAWSRYVPERRACIYLIGANDSATLGIFHKLTGALTGKGLQILSAEIHTLADRLVLDRFYVDDPDFSGEPPPERTQEVCDALVAALTVNADKPPVFRRLWKTESGSIAADFAELPTRIRFDDATSDRYTIVTIFAYDRSGLLYSISRTLFELGLVVHVARVATYLDQVVDVFYVTDTEGRKIYSQSRRNEIRLRLTAALDPEASNQP